MSTVPSAAVLACAGWALDENGMVGASASLSRSKASPGSGSNWSLERATLLQLAQVVIPYTFTCSDTICTYVLYQAIPLQLAQ